MNEPPVLNAHLPPGIALQDPYRYDAERYGELRTGHHHRTVRCLHENTQILGMVHTIFVT